MSGQDPVEPLLIEHGPIAQPKEGVWEVRIRRPRVSMAQKELLPEGNNLTCAPWRGEGWLPG